MEDASTIRGWHYYFVDGVLGAAYFKVVST